MARTEASRQVLTYQHDATIEALVLAYAANLPAYLIGDPGLGKSSVIKAMVADIREQNGWDDQEYRAVLLAGSRHAPEDFTGLPFADGADGVTDFLPLRWAMNLCNAAEGGTLFLDEITTASQSVQSAMLQVTLDREVGYLYLGPKIRIVLAGNDPDVAANGWELTAPLANRLVHIPWQPPAQTFVNGWLTGFPKMHVPLISPDKVDASRHRARSIVASFINANPALYHVLPKSPSDRGGAWPSPRTWEMVWEALAYAEAVGASAEAISVLVHGCVGYAAALEFLQFYNNLDLPDPERLLADPASFEMPERQDQRYAVVGSLVSAIASNTTTERWEACMSLFVKMGQQQGKDIAAFGMKALATPVERGGLRPPGSTLPAELAKVLGPLVEQAGL